MHARRPPSTPTRPSSPRPCARCCRSRRSTISSSPPLPARSRSAPARRWARPSRQRSERVRGDPRRGTDHTVGLRERGRGRVRAREHGDGDPCPVRALDDADLVADARQRPGLPCPATRLRGKPEASRCGQTWRRISRRIAAQLSGAAARSAHSAASSDVISRAVPALVRVGSRTLQPGPAGAGRSPVEPTFLHVPRPRRRRRARPRCRGNGPDSACAEARARAAVRPPWRCRRRRRARRRPHCR